MALQPTIGGPRDRYWPVLRLSSVTIRDGSGCDRRYPVAGQYAPVPRLGMDFESTDLDSPVGTSLPDRCVVTGSTRRTTRRTDAGNIYRILHGAVAGLPYLRPDRRYGRLLTGQYDMALESRQDVETTEGNKKDKEEEGGDGFEQ